MVKASGMSHGSAAPLPTYNPARIAFLTKLQMIGIYAAVAESSYSLKRGSAQHESVVEFHF